MKFTLCLGVFAALSAIALAINVEAEKNNQQPQVRVDPATSSLVVAAVVPIITSLVSGFINFLQKPTDYQDTIIYGRPMRINICPAGNTPSTQFCVTITDRASGHSHTGTGATNQEAIGEATKKIFDDLLTHDLLSLHDLCELHIVFPHPDQQQCPGAVINPCHLIHPVVTTPKPCVDTLGERYCRKNIKYCDQHIHLHHMTEGCLKTCTNGTCKTEADKPIDPCNTKPY